MTKGRVIVAMSGGVDSSVAAPAAEAAGLRCRGRHHAPVDRRDATTSPPPASAAVLSRTSTTPAASAQTIGVPHYVMNFEREFEEHVVDYFCREYDRGRTPHPCLACNDKIKFDFLLRRALFLDAEYVATGHYARVRRGPAGFELLKGIDSQEGPVLRPLHPDPARTGSAAPSGGRAPQGPRARAGRGGRSAGRRQARQPGDLLHTRRTTTASSSVAAPAPSRETSSTRAGKCLVRIRGYSSSPWGKGAGSASGETPALPSTWCVSTQPATG